MTVITMSLENIDIIEKSVNMISVQCKVIENLLRRSRQVSNTTVEAAGNGGRLERSVSDGSSDGTVDILNNLVSVLTSLVSQITGDMGSRKRSRPSMLFDIDDDGINNGIGSGMTAGPMRSDYSTAHPLAHNEAAAAVTARRHTPLGYTQHTAHVRPCGYFGVTPSMETAAVAASTSRSVPSLLEDPSRAYVYYSCSNYEQLRIAHPEWNSNTINGELGRMWNALAPEERQAWGTCTAEAKSLVDSSLTSHRTSPSSAQPPLSGAGMQSQTSDSW